ncbi:MAG: (Fe-S)-binding protein [Proteobacteria bacterium]|nr:(Fe-S)-binding protein [Pseudomonadota bacterium]
MEHEEILHRCFRCGYCKLPENYSDLNCPSYIKYRFETFSPGGRMWLLRAWLDKKLEPTERFQEIFFSCVTCGNCVEHCAFPDFKDELLLAFTAGKEALVDSGKVPPPVRDCLTKLQSHGNPYGLAPKNRGNWTEGLDVEDYSGQDYLLYIGDVGSYDSRGQEIAESVAGLLRKQKVSFGILGADEISDGNEAKALGETELFRHLAEENIKKFKSLGVEKIIALSPHGYNAIKNEYPLWGGQFQVLHYSQMLGDIVEKAEFSSPNAPLRVTFHDPCYLGRHNYEYGSARAVLGSLPGLELVEMDRCLQNALCCGGGGGNVFTDILGGGRETSARSRVREARETGARILAVACPGCAVMLEDALKAEKLETELQVKEVSEIVQERLV